jgi:hypothetical protein
MVWNFVARNFGWFHELTLSTIGNERKPLSRCHCKYAATSPEASRRFRTSLRSALAQSPVNKSDINFSVSTDGVAEADGLQLMQTEPPPTKEKYLCGPGASQREQIVIEGA